MHSPLGWPSLETLLQVRRFLEPHAPAGAAWPDFWISPDELAQSPLFSDPSGTEAAFAEKFRPSTASAPAAFDRSQEQLLWVGRVLQRFVAPLRQWQAWELEASWHDYQVRTTEEAERCAEMLDDGKTSSSNSPRPPIDAAMTPLLTPTPQPDTPALGSISLDQSLDAGTPQPLPPRPVAPTGLPKPPAVGAVNVRQLLTYLCQGSAPEDGITRSLAVLCAGDGKTVAPVDFHTVLLQIGARSTPATTEGDGRPCQPALKQLCEELELSTTSAVNTSDLLRNQSLKRWLARTNIDRRHCRAEVEKLFVKNPRPNKPRTVEAA